MAKYIHGYVAYGRCHILLFVTPIYGLHSNHENRGDLKVKEWAMSKEPQPFQCQKIDPIGCFKKRYQMNRKERDCIVIGSALALTTFDLYFIQALFSIFLYLGKSLLTLRNRTHIFNINLYRDVLGKAFLLYAIELIFLTYTYIEMFYY